MVYTIRFMPASVSVKLRVSERLILLLLETGVTSRAELQERTGLTRAALVSSLRLLVKRGLILERGTGPASRNMYALSGLASLIVMDVNIKPVELPAPAPVRSPVELLSELSNTAKLLLTAVSTKGRHTRLSLAYSTHRPSETVRAALTVLVGKQLVAVKGEGRAKRTYSITETGAGAARYLETTQPQFTETELAEVETMLSLYKTQHEERQRSSAL
jgi:hypothetical protein